MSAPGRFSGSARWAVPVVWLLGALVTAFLPGLLGAAPPRESALVSLVEPSRLASLMWAVVLLGLAGHAVWQRATNRKRPKVALRATLVCGLVWGWLWAERTNTDWLAAVLGVATVVVTGTIHHQLSTMRARSAAEIVAVDVPFGLTLGWSLVAAVAALGTLVLPPVGQPGWWWSLVGAVVVGALGATGAGLLLSARASWGVTIGVVWGLAWIAVARFSEPRDVAVGVVAAVAALGLLVLAVLVARQRSATLPG